MSEKGHSLSCLGLYTLMTAPYALKAFIGPFLDSNFLQKLPLGPRRFIALCAQAGLISLFLLSALTMAHPKPFWTFLTAFLISTVGAIQDLSLEAYRIESTPSQAVGVSVWASTVGFRIGFLLAGGGGLYMAEMLSWPHTYLILAGALLVGPLCVLLVGPEKKTTKERFRPSWTKAYRHLNKRLAFTTIFTTLVTVKCCDSILSAFSGPFFIHLGYTKLHIAETVKVWGFLAMLGGHSLYGWLLMRYPIRSVLASTACLQLVSITLFLILGSHETSTPLLLACSLAQHIGAAAVMTTLIAIMTYAAKAPYTAAQSGLMASFSSLTRIGCTMGAGYASSVFGWTHFLWLLLGIQTAFATILIIRAVLPRPVFKRP